MYLMRQIGPRGVYGQPDPARLHGLPELEGAALVLARLRPFRLRGADGACSSPALLAFVFGWFAFRSRVTGVYLSIITQAMTYALMLAFFRNDMGFGGNNGLTDFKDILGFPLQARDDARRALRRYRRSRSPPAPRSAASIVALEARQGPGRDPRRRKPHALPRLPRRALQALRLHALGRARGRRRRALRAAGRHHQPERVRARPTRSRS